MNPVVFLCVLFMVFCGVVVLAFALRFGIRGFNPLPNNFTKPFDATPAPVEPAGQLEKRIEPKYRAILQLLTPAELSFFGVLRHAIPSGTTLFTKVRLADLIQPQASQDRTAWQSAFNKICAKHADFVLCDAATMKVLGVIELDDSPPKVWARQAPAHTTRASEVASILIFS